MSEATPGIEIEQRWIVHEPDAATLLKKLDLIRDDGELIHQGYLSEPDDPARAIVRVRKIVPYDQRKPMRGVLTFKQGKGKSRVEHEEDIPPMFAGGLIDNACISRLTKIRYRFTAQDGKTGEGRDWELDVFQDGLGGMLILECEHGEPDLEAVPPADFIRTTEVTDTVTNYHLALLARDMDIRQTENGLTSGIDALPRLPALTSRIPIVVLTGGPGSGKTTILNALAGGDSLVRDKVMIVPETASILIGQVGIRPPISDALGMRQFMRLLLRVQRTFERAAIWQAAREGKKLIIVDRGTVDSAAYLPGRLDELARIVGRTIGQEYMNYSRVVWLPAPPRDIYDRIKANNPARRENYEEAQETSEALRYVWQDHPAFRVVTGRTWNEISRNARHELLDDIMD